jgi:hypothetical protein
MTRKIYMAPADHLQRLFESQLHVKAKVWRCDCQRCQAAMARHPEAVMQASVVYARTLDQRVYFMANTTHHPTPCPTFYIDNVEDIGLLLRSDLMGDDREMFVHWFNEGGLKVVLLSAEAVLSAGAVA